MDAPEPFTLTYRVAMAVCVPLVSLWGRLEVEGLEVLPRSGPTLVVANHDSQTDPLAVGVAARSRRQIRALAKRSLWDKPGLGRVLDGMGQIPIERAAGDADALVNAVAALRRGSCIGVFPEGTISVGRRLRARSGIGRLALEVPEARLVCASGRGHAGPRPIPAASAHPRPLLRAGLGPDRSLRDARRSLAAAAGRASRHSPRPSTRAAIPPRRSKSTSGSSPSARRVRRSAVPKRPIESGSELRPSSLPCCPHAPVAQLDRASVYETEGHRFESCRARFDQPPAQAGIFRANIGSGNSAGILICRKLHACAPSCRRTSVSSRSHFR